MEWLGASMGLSEDHTRKRQPNGTSGRLSSLDKGLEYSRPGHDSRVSTLGVVYSHTEWSIVPVSRQGDTVLREEKESKLTRREENGKDGNWLGLLQNALFKSLWGFISDHSAL